MAILDFEMDAEPEFLERRLQGRRHRHWMKRRAELRWQ